MGARIVLPQPRGDALAMEPMRAGQHRNGVTEGNFIHADAAVGFSRRFILVGRGEGAGGKRFYRGVGRWARGIARLVLFH